MRQMASTDRSAKRSLIACWRSANSLFMVASVGKSLAIATRSNCNGSCVQGRPYRCQDVIHNRQMCQACTGGSQPIAVSHALAETCQRCAVGSQLANLLYKRFLENWTESTTYSFRQASGWVARSWKPILKLFVPTLTSVFGARSTSSEMQRRRWHMAQSPS